VTWLNSRHSQPSIAVCLDRGGRKSLLDGDAGEVRVAADEPLCGRMSGDRSEFRTCVASNGYRGQPVAAKAIDDHDVIGGEAQPVEQTGRCDLGLNLRIAAVLSP
jgi:hypothetical protein